MLLVIMLRVMSGSLPDERVLCYKLYVKPDDAEVSGSLCTLLEFIRTVARLLNIDLLDYTCCFASVL